MRFKKITFLIILILFQGLSLALTSFAYHRVETFEKRLISFKIKAHEDFNHRNILNIPRIEIRMQRRGWAKVGVLRRSRVVFVYDGDTILLKNGTSVRYLGVNTPEIDHKGGKSEFMAYTAKAFNQKLVKGALVRLEYDLEREDRYKRVLAYIFLQNGEMVNALLVRKGLAHVMSIRPNLKYRNLLLGCQRKAMKERVGIWKNLVRDRGERCLGNRKSFRFHRPDCPFGKKISQKNLIRFRSVYDAFWEGYSPCRRCMPWAR